MNAEIKLGNSGSFPIHLNLASSNTKIQIKDDVTAPLVDFSSCGTTYIGKQESIPVQQYVIYR